MTEEAKPGFEEAISELEKVVEALDREEPDLDRALELFENGVGHLRTASRILEETRGRVQELIRDASGELETVGLDVPGAEGDEDDG